MLNTETQHSSHFLSIHGHKYGNVFRPAYGSKLFHPDGV